MTLIEFIILLIIAGVAGAIGQSLGGYRRGGILLAIVLGFVGAFLGTWLARNMGLPLLLEVSVGGVSFPILWAILGAALLVALVGFAGRGGGRYWGITPPTRIVLSLSILLAVLAGLVSAGTVSISISAFTLLAAAYLLLLLGNLVRGL
ncbi:MAG: GlsB/YeaQ/YmgE family stress response membrane protein [Anaerolineales bacterium]